MGYCSGPTGTASLDAADYLAVTVGTTTSCATQNHLTANTAYSMTWLQGDSTNDCMYGTQTVGSFTTDGSGGWSGNTSTFSPAVGAFQFCVSNSTDHTGNQVGLTGVL
jgi:hypothetical protein